MELDDDLPFDDTEEVVTDDGEIITLPKGNDGIQWLAEQALSAAEQQKMWTSRAAWLRTQIAMRQETKSAVYGDISVSMAQATSFDRDRFMAYVEDAGLEYGDLLDLLRNATNVSADGLPQHLAAAVAKARKPGATYPRVSRVRRLAPRG